MALGRKLSLWIGGDYETKMQSVVVIYKRFIGPTALLCSILGLIVLIVRFRQGLDIGFLLLGLVLGLLSWKSKYGKVAVIIPVCVTLFVAVMIPLSNIPASP